MSEQRQRVEAEAREWSQAELWICRDCERGFIAGRTVTAEQVKEALAAWDTFAPDLSKSMTENLHDAMGAAFRAAGLLIKGEDDE